MAQKNRHIRRTKIVSLNCKRARKKISCFYTNGLREIRLKSLDHKIQVMARYASLNSASSSSPDVPM